VQFPEQMPAFWPFASTPPFPYNSRLARSAELSSGGFAPTFSFGRELFPSSVADRVLAIAERVTLDHGLELVHAEVAGPDNKPIVRIFIDKPNGVTHRDCSEVSLHVGTVLDVEDFIHASYTLEVSSPGLERGLYKAQDYERFAGRSAKLKTRRPINGQRNFRGRLLGINGEEVLFEDRTSGRVEIPLDSIAKANLEFDVEQEFRRAQEASGQ
jgi:ribosome maturation factor RimP